MSGPLVDIHIHFMPSALLRAYRAREVPPLIEDDGASVVLRYGSGYVERIATASTDPANILRTLDRDGIDVAVLSINQPGVLGLAADDACVTAREANDELAELVHSSGGRLGGLATLPWQCPAEASEELRRAVRAGLCGAMVCSNVAGSSLDEERFEQVFATAASLDVPLLLHPTVPLSIATLGDYGLTCSVGFLFDTTTAILRLVLGGLFDRYPGLKIIVGHSGSLLPQLAGRLDLEIARGAIFARPAKSGPLSESYLRLLYTDSVSGSVPPLIAAIGLFGSDHVMFGTDFPFWDPKDSIRVLDQLSLPELDLERLRGGNAMELFGLEGPAQQELPPRHRPS
jgi:aminocarboxymuconate-semialdehyde decarboxylase